MTFKKITSTQNSYIKELVLLKDKSKNRKKSGLFLIEGEREVSLALKANYEIATILFYPELFSEEKRNKFQLSGVEIIEVSKEVYQKLAYRSTTEGIIAIAKTKESAIENLKFNTPNPLLLIAEAPEKPGNIGAILRTADAANVDAVIIANPKTDLYNPNIIRSLVLAVYLPTKLRQEPQRKLYLF